MPRMIGRPTPGPKYEDCTPGRRFTVSPSELALASSRRAPARTSTGRARSSAVCGSGVARTTTADRSLTSSWRASSCARAGAVARARMMAAGSRPGRERTEGRKGIRLGLVRWVMLYYYHLIAPPRQQPGSHARPAPPPLARSLRRHGLAHVRAALRAVAGGDRGAAVAGDCELAERWLRAGLRALRHPA